MASSPLENLTATLEPSSSSEPGSPRVTSKRRPPSARSSGRLDGMVIALSKSSLSQSSSEDISPPMHDEASEQATGAPNRPSSPIPFNLETSPNTNQHKPSPLSVASFSRPPPQRPTMSSPSSLVPGKLNAATSEKAGALPPSRRGASYTLTKAKNAAAQTQKSASMQVIGALNRPSHYERYGTIELLLNLGQDSELLQLLKAEGYDCLVMDSDKAEDSKATGDLLQVFNSQDVYPDVVLLDCDQPLSNTAIIRTLQSQQPLVSIICIGAVDSKMDAISCLQAGAVDYLTKPLDAMKQEELLARIERHVARQHGSKVSIEAALSEARAIISRMEQMEQIRAAAANMANLDSERTLSFSSTGPLGAVAENIEYEEQAVEIAQLQSENEELKQQIEMLTAKLEDMIA